jgi:hypothetical protein
MPASLTQVDNLNAHEIEHGSLASPVIHSREPDTLCLDKIRTPIPMTNTKPSEKTLDESISFRECHPARRLASLARKCYS